MKRFIILIIIFSFLFGHFQAVNAWSINTGKIFVLADTLIQKVTDLIIYLSKQKEYLISDYRDPNQYVDLQGTTDIEKVVNNLGGITMPETKPSNKPVELTSEAILTPEKILVVVPKNDPKIPDINLPPVINLASTSISKIIPKFITSGDYSSSEILVLTNDERKKANLGLLSGNKVLDAIAKLKLEDLFSRQYFAHESPTGQSAADLAKQIGYGYLIIGENLALGNFGDDQGIVKAWMNSPGHRANILNSRFRELGVAKRDGKYEGRSVTIAVQIFGNPQTACARPDYETQKLINQSSVSIKVAESKAKEMYDSLIAIKNEPGLDQAYYNQKIQEYNYYAKNINIAIVNLKRVTEAFNRLVVDYNYCINH